MTNLQMTIVISCYHPTTQFTNSFLFGRIGLDLLLLRHQKSRMRQGAQGPTGGKSSIHDVNSGCSQGWQSQRRWSKRICATSGSSVQQYRRCTCWQERPGQLRRAERQRVGRGASRPACWSHQTPLNPRVSPSWSVNRHVCHQPPPVPHVPCAS